MFQKEFIIKRYLFLFVDILSLVAALVLANIIRFRELQLRDFDDLYLEVLVVSILACCFGNVVFGLEKHIFDRGYYQEFIAIMKSCATIFVSVLVYLYFSQKGLLYSRLQMLYMLPIYAFLSFLGHMVLRKFVSDYYRRSTSRKQIMLLTSSDKVDDILEKFETTNNWYFQIAYLVFADADRKGEEYHGIPVIANVSDMLEMAKNITLDGVFINVSYQSHMNFNVRDVLHGFQSMGVIVHVNIDALELDVSEKVVENLGMFKVVSYASRLRNPGQMIMKKLMDIIGGLIGCVLTILVGIFLVPAIKLDSPGPAIYSQTRVGRNGRHFKMYKFRSMYQDADERKKALMAQNEMQGAMFKMENDPRITKVGKFIRKYSLDELPQFFNVLKGDMSLVGTRPPTVDEVEQYRIEQKRRLSVTPGMTGLWQTSGRSDILDFDEIVKMDLRYIDQWSVGLDIKLLFKTILVCFKGSGAK